MNAPATPPRAELARTLGVTDLVLLVIGTVIGSGIFIVPAVVLRQVQGSLSLAVLVWVLAGVLSLLGALTYGELGAGRPDAGGLYAYIRDAFGPLPAFLYGWTKFFVIASGSAATLAVAFSSYLKEFVALSPIQAKMVAVAMLIVIGFINVRGTRRSAGVQNWSTGVKLGAIVIMSVLLLGRGSGMSGAMTALPTFTPSLLTGLGLSLIGVLWAYEGWQYVTFAAGETRDAQRTFPLAITVGTALLIVLYLLVNLGYVAALGVTGVQETERVAATAVNAVFGPVAAKGITVIILVAMFSATNGLTLTAPRLYFSMARDGVFFAKLGELHPRFGTPAFAIIAGTVWASLLALTGTFEQLLTYVVFSGWIFYGLGAMSLFVFRRRSGPPATFRVPGYPVTPLLFVGASAAIVLNAVITAPAQALIGLGAVLAGIPAFLYWRRGRQGSPPPR
ncbi:MAG: amino acid permease [Gemmatimonadota bacterium]|nr:amino acid permease [Gemmatimonadota bacterium]MDQ8167275.1 amino acid permease [Gemmatimonadota bacterium]MDQ8172041.1 amino acid permease [Gemmatimonadota bacterium]